MLKVLLDDGMQIVRGTGIGNYSSRLFKELNNRPGVSADLYKASPNGGDLSRLKYLSRINSSKFAQLASTYDICIFTNYVIPIRKLNSKTVAVVHDLVSFDVPEALPYAFRKYNQAAIRHDLKKADIVLTVSETMATAIKTRFPNHRADIRWSWSGPLEHVNKVTEDNSLGNDREVIKGLAPKRFFLFVSTIEKRKNVSYVIRAFNQLKATCPSAADYRLVLAGRPGYGYESIKDEAERGGHSEDILFTGYVSNEECSWLYNNAAAMVFPTLYEGFGFAQLECMQTNLPMLLSDIAINREISGDCGQFFSLTDIDTLVQAMEGVVNDSVAMHRQIDKYPARLQLFNWNNVVNEILR